MAGRLAGQPASTTVIANACTITDALNRALAVLTSMPSTSHNVAGGEEALQPDDRKTGPDRIHVGHASFDLNASHYIQEDAPKAIGAGVQRVPESNLLIDACGCRPCGLTNRLWLLCKAYASRASSINGDRGRPALSLWVRFGWWEDPDPRWITAGSDHTFLETHGSSRSRWDMT